ncbi:MAG: polyprenyl synthetase family protein [Actinomycetota bacterium]|nr:polyprenyl synthetase family protein [Actinomycetota bacterium]
MRTPDELRALVESYLADLALTPELGELAQPMRYATGGKLIRPVLCLATAEATGAEPEAALPAAAAVELVHSFSLVHDDLPALDDDDVRRGKPSVHVEFGEMTAVLTGDALLVEAFRLGLFYPTPEVGRELAQTTAGMIGGQYLDLASPDADRTEVRRLKTGALFEACVGCALWVAGVPRGNQAPWRAFAAELGPLFQLVDDILDEDGAALEHGADGARRLADEAAERAHARLRALDADTSVLADIVSGLATRTA